MHGFQTAALLITIAAAAGFVNYRLLRLPQTSGTLVVALVTSLMMLAVDAVQPAWGLRTTAMDLLGHVDFNQMLMGGMLSFLLFAGALHLNLDEIVAHRWSIASLATVGVAVSTCLVGLLTWWAFGWLGVTASLPIWLVFGALISPTDPIAVMGLLKELRAPRSLEAQIGGESLFNDGVAVVVFFALTAAVGFSESAGPVNAHPRELVGVFLAEVGGGALLGLVVGWIGYLALRAVDDHSLELLITLAIVMLGYALALRLHISGPIAVVCSGLLIGNRGRRLAMSDRTREHLDGFWEMLDAVLNSVLFLLIGLEVFTLSAGWKGLAAAVTAIPIGTGGQVRFGYSPWRW